MFRRTAHQYRAVLMVVFVVIFAFIGYTILRQSHAASGDINGDGKVNVLDLSVLATHYGQTGQTLVHGDLTGDGSVTILDLSVLAAGWGTDYTFISQLRTGTSLTQWSLDCFNGCAANAAAVANGKALLNASTYTVSQPFMGFGVGSPSPTDCVSQAPNCVPSDPVNLYDFSGLDKRIGPSGVTSNSPEVVLNINAVPGWMRNEPDFGTAPDGSAYIGHVPPPASYDEFADLIAAEVQHYPNIKYLTIWSEMRGFFNSSTNDWNTSDYIAMYNTIWDKIKSPPPAGIGRSDIKIGGPYPSVTSSSKTPDAITASGCTNLTPGRSYDSTEQYAFGPWGWSDKRDLQVIKDWLKLKHGADFIIFDERNHHDYGDEKPILYPECVDRFAQNDKFESTAKWIRNLYNVDPVHYADAATLPIWMVEWYSRWNTPDDTLSIAQQTNQGTEAQRAAVMTDGLIKIVKSGLYQRAFLWGPQGEANTNGWMHPLGLFTDTRVVGGGQPTEFYNTQKWINDYFSSGNTITDVTSSNPAVTLLASPSKLLMVNTTGSVQTTTVLGANFSLNAYEVALRDVPN